MAETLAKFGALLIGWGQQLAQQHQQTAADKLQAQADAIAQRHAALVSQIAHLRSGS